MGRRDTTDKSANKFFLLLRYKQAALEALARQTYAFRLQLCSRIEGVGQEQRNLMRSSTCSQWECRGSAIGRDI